MFFNLWLSHKYSPTNIVVVVVCSEEVIPTMLKKHTNNKPKI